MELELGLLLAEVDTAGKPIISDALTAGRARFTLVFNDGLRLFLGGFACFTTDVFNIENTHGANALKFSGFLANDGFENTDVGQVAIESCADRRPFSMSLSDSLFTDKLHFYFLAGA